MAQSEPKLLADEDRVCTLLEEIGITENPGYIRDINDTLHSLGCGHIDTVTASNDLTWIGISSTKLCIVKSNIAQRRRHCSGINVITRQYGRYEQFAKEHGETLANELFPKIFLVTADTIVMEYVEPLSNMTLSKEKEIFTQEILKTIGKLHKTGYVHCDLGISNIGLVPDSAPRKWKLFDLESLRKTKNCDDYIADIRFFKMCISSM